MKAYSIKRFGMTGKWDVNEIFEMQGTPQRPGPTKPGLHIPVLTRIKPEVPFNMPGMKPAREEEAPRRTYVMKRHFEKFGYTQDCEGSARLSTGMKSRPHAGKCRVRMYEELKRTEEGRKWMVEAENRINEYLEEKVKEDHAEKDKKEREEAERAECSAAPMAQDKDESQAGSSDVTPQDNVTQKDL